MWYVTLWIAPELNRVFAAANSANSDTQMLLDGIIPNLINNVEERSAGEPEAALDPVEDDLNTGVALGEDSPFVYTAADFETEAIANELRNGGEGHDVEGDYGT